MIRDKKKRLSGRFISILAFVIMICSAGMFFVAVPSFAESSDVIYHETEEEAAEELRGHMKQREETVTIGLMGSKDQEGLQEIIGKLVKDAIAHTGNPDEGDYIGYQYGSYEGHAHTMYVGFSPAIEIKYKLSYYDDAQQEAEVDKKVDEIIESLELEDKTDFEKIAAIHDYICDNVEYGSAEKGGDTVRTAYGALIEGRAVCQGYSVSLYRLLLEAGIDNRIIFGKGLSETGDSGAHTWNIIELNDEYYYIDATWDDAGYQYQYFMVPAETSFEDSHIADESYDEDFFTEDYPMSDEAYKDEAVGLRGRMLKMMKAMTSGIQSLLSLNY